MDSVTRIGVSLEPELLKAFDEAISKKGYVSRSEALRDLVRDSLSESEWKDDGQLMTGIMIVIFNGESMGVRDRIGSIMKQKRGSIISNTSINLGTSNIMDVVIVDDTLGELKSVLNEIVAVKGVLRAKLSMISPSSGHMHHIGVRN